MNYVEGGATAPKGFLAAGTHCGLRKNKNKPDLGLLYSEYICETAAVYTANLIKGAPLVLTKENLAKTNNKSRALIINSGVANACVPDGYEKAKAVTKIISEQMNLPLDEVLSASTGKIGTSLDLNPIINSAGDLISKLDKKNDFAAAILTTDLVKKEKSAEIIIDGVPARIGGAAKGSGMVRPDMATLLCFLTTDLNIAQPLLEKAFREAADYSFNRVSVDGDTSTNDFAMIMANGAAGNKLIDSEDNNYFIFKDALKQISLDLSRMVARDGVGATKSIECVVKNFRSETEAVALAKSIISSNLVKTAFFGADPNIGRIICAMGYSRVNFDFSLVDADICGVKILSKGEFANFSPKEVSEALKNSEIIININMNQGEAEGFALGCDMTYEFINMNGLYKV
jgi:glutamate N-acetyltransferase/amino-acid N-acetyltransferase